MANAAAAGVVVDIPGGVRAAEQESDAASVAELINGAKGEEGGFVASATLGDAKAARRLPVQRERKEETRPQKRCDRSRRISRASKISAALLCERRRRSAIGKHDVTSRPNYSGCCRNHHGNHATSGASSGNGSRGRLSAAAAAGGGGPRSATGRRSAANRLGRYHLLLFVLTFSRTAPAPAPAPAATTTRRGLLGDKREGPKMEQLRQCTMAWTR